MQLLDRYTNAIKSWLPVRSREDIGAELLEDIRSQIAESEEACGHALDDEEVAAILRQRGRPMIIAGSYKRSMHLIGPTLFPLYMLVLKMVLACSLAPWIISWLGIVVLNLSRHDAGTVLRLAFAAWGPFWLAACFLFTCVTVLFVILEQHQARTDFLSRWDPRRLPAMGSRPGIPTVPRSTIVAEMTGSFIGMACLATIMGGLPMPVGGAALGLQLSQVPAWHGLQRVCLPLIILAAIRAVSSTLILVRPTWMRIRQFLAPACDGTAALILLLLAAAQGREAAGDVLAVTGSGVLPPATSAADWANIGISGSLAIAGLVCVAVAIRGLMQLGRGLSRSASAP